VNTLHCKDNFFHASRNLFFFLCQSGTLSKILDIKDCSCFCDQLLKLLCYAKKTLINDSDRLNSSRFVKKTCNRVRIFSLRERNSFLQSYFLFFSCLYTASCLPINVNRKIITIQNGKYVYTTSVLPSQRCSHHHTTFYTDHEKVWSRRRYVANERHQTNVQHQIYRCFIKLHYAIYMVM